MTSSLERYGIPHKGAAEMDISPQGSPNRPSVIQFNVMNPEDPENPENPGILKYLTPVAATAQEDNLEGYVPTSFIKVL